MPQGEEYLEVKDELAGSPADGPLSSPLPSGEGYQLVDEFDAEDGLEMKMENEEQEEVDEDMAEVDVKEDDVETTEETEEYESVSVDTDTTVLAEDEESHLNEEPRETRLSGKRKVESDSPEQDNEMNAPVRKSSRLRTKVLQQAVSIDSSPVKLKMLQKPGERPNQVEESEEEDVDDDEDEENKKREVAEGGAAKGNTGKAGDPSREPGADAERRVDPDFLLPFRLGWSRECVFREVKNAPRQVEIYYYPPKEEPGSRKKEAVRRRRSKVDQERYFEEFPHPRLSVTNFSYVRRPLGINNEAYEMIRETKMGLETRATRASDKMKETKKSYREVAEHEGLLSSSASDGEGDDDEIQEITEFDIGLPLTLQVLSRVTPLREEHKKRRKWPDRDRCLTPPLAEDLPWTSLDDDPLGVHTSLYNKQCSDRVQCPATPPPLRAVRLTKPDTISSLEDMHRDIRQSLPDPLDRISSSNKELHGSEHLASHDIGIRKFKNYRPPQILGQARPPPTIRRPLSASPGISPSPSPSPAPATAKPGLPNSRPPPSPLQGFVKVRLPMPSTNGKRPVVELVMLTNGKYQPIKFTNNRQVTESIPKRLFDQANLMKKTLYQRSMQVPKIGTKQVFLAINPTPGGVRPYNSSPSPAKPGVPPPASKPVVPSLVKPVPPSVKSPVKSAVSAPRPTSSMRPAPVPSSPSPHQSQQRPVPQTSDQVSILVRPAGGGNAVLLNVPRSVAVKVKQGTTLSFSASNDQKYTVIDNKMHPPVGRQKSASPKPAAKPSPPPPQSRPSSLPSLPSGVSIRPVAPGTAQANRKPQRPFGQPAGQLRNKLTSPRPNTNNTGSSGRGEMFNYTPCSPFCPGVTGGPELECTQCHSLFHPKCVSIPTWRVVAIQSTFKCKRCAGPVGKAEVIDLD